MNCLQKIVPGEKAQTLVQSLMQEHMDLLKQYSYWDHILNTWKQLIEEATSQHQGNGQMSKISTCMLNILF